MKFQINTERLFHLLRHFEKIDQNCFDKLTENGYSEKQIFDTLKGSGSLFLYSFLSSPCQLPEVFSLLKPIEQKIQANGLYAFKYILNKHLGTNGLIAINKLNNEDCERISVQKRDGFEIKVITGVKAAMTNEAHIIAGKENGSDHYNIVTCFPGSLSPPFPKYISNEKERKFSETFWKKHVLIVQ